MADVVDCLHINDITVMCTLDSEDDLADRKDTMLLARVQIDNILLDEMEPCLPIIYEGMGGRPAARWELGSLQIPTDCCPFTLIITTTRHFEIFRFEIRGSDGMWDTEGVESEEIHLRFRAQVSLYHPSSRFHRGCYTTPGSDVVRRDIPPAEPWDERTGFPHWLLGFLPAELLLHLGMQHYFRAQSSPGDNVYLNHALAAFERALEDPNIDPDLSQVLETIIPFLYCREQGYSSCLDIALQVLQTFPGLPKAQLNAQLFLQLVVFDVMKRFEWHDHVPLAIRLITGQLKLLLHSASLATWKLFAGWVIFAYRLAPSAKEVLPLMDLMVDFHYGFLTSKGWESLPMMRATVYFMHAIEPGGPSLGVTLGAAEFVMHLLPAGHSPHLGLTFGLAFIDWSIIWLLDVLARDSDESKPCKDRILSFIAWQLSNLPLHQELQGSLRVIQSRLRGNMCIYASERVKAAMSRPPILDDNDNQFIEAILQDLRHQRSGKVIPAEYPKGAAELVRNLLMDADSGLEVFILSCGVAATIAHALRLPEAFKVYELFMSSLDREDRPTTFASYGNVLNSLDMHRLIARDAISCASETGNYTSALQWSDQGSSQIWNWLFHSRLSICEGSATDPVIARKLKARSPWIDSWAKPQQGEPDYALRDGQEFYLAIPGYNRLPGLERFWRPKTPAEIISLSEVLGGPIVYLNVNRYSSHALAVLPGLDDVVHIPLPDLGNTPMLHALSVEFMKSPQTFLQEGSLMQELWERLGHTVPKPGQRPTPSVDFQVSGALFLEYLWIVVVKPILDGLGIQRAQQATADMPRIWWCPSGPLNGLPIHAAGCYTDDGQGPVISDYVVSSYFPSASALTYATRPEDPSQKFSLLTIANPTGAGLPGTEWELEKIKTHTTTQELTRGDVTVKKVKKGMQNASWAHFACHGVTNPDKPWESALILANHTRLSLREISDMSLPHAEFAYLSACQTAKGVVQAPDQSAHLSTGMLACGYRGVIGMMWQISDEYVPFVADRVYAKMLEGRPDYKRAACALHDAVLALRKEPGVGFHTWLPFIHVGV